MRRIVLAGMMLVLSSAAFAAGNLTWDPVTTAIDGGPDGAATYNCYSRAAGSTGAWTKMGTVTAPTVMFPLPNATSRLEYAVTAVDAAGNESGISNIVTAKPNAPGNAVVVK